MHKVFAWIWYSSSDPTKVSLTVKSTIAIAGSQLMSIIGLAHVVIPGAPAYIDTIANDVSGVVLSALTIVGLVGGLVGVITKIYKSVTGTNPVISPAA